MVAIVRELRHRTSDNDPVAPVRHHLLATRKAILVGRAVRKSMKKIASTALELFREKPRSARSTYDPRSLRSDARRELRPRCSSGMRIRRARWLVQKTQTRVASNGVFLRNWNITSTRVWRYKRRECHYQSFVHASTATITIA